MSEIYYPNYAYVGAPTVYNGTGGSGGDSGKKPLKISQGFLPFLSRTLVKANFLNSNH